MNYTKYIVSFSNGNVETFYTTGIRQCIIVAMNHAIKNAWPQELIYIDDEANSTRYANIMFNITYTEAKQETNQ